MKLTRVMALARKEWQEILRDRLYFLLAFLLPIALMLVFGHGMSQDVANIPFAVMDYDRSVLSRRYAHRYIESRYFDFKGYLRGIDQAEPLLVDNAVRLILVIPESFQEDLRAGRPAQVQTLLDGTFTLPLRTIDGYVRSINASASGELQIDYLSRRLGISHERARSLLQPLRIEVRYLYNQELRDTWSVAPSLIMFVLTVTVPMLTALSVVREKETGTIYTIHASTISRAEFLAGKLVPNVAVAFFNALVLVLIATQYFGAPLKGSLPFFLLAALVYVVCVSGVGLLISVLVNTQIAAIIVTIVLTMIVNMQFSGLLTPVSSMEGPNYWLAHVFPPKYFNDVVIKTFLKGGGFTFAWPEVLVLSGFSVGFLALGYRLFHKRTRT